MKWRNTLIMLAVAIAAGLFVWKVVPSWKTTDENMQGRIFPEIGARKSDIDRIELKHGDETLVLVKLGEERWDMTSPIEYRADPFRAGSLLSTLEFIKEDVLPIKPDEGESLDLARFGLAPGSETASLKLQAGAEQVCEVRVGSLTPDEESFFLWVAGREAVYVVRKHIRDEFTRKVDHFRSTDVAPFEAAEVRKVVLAEAGNRSFEIVKDGGSWKMTHPVADRVAVEALKSLLDDLSMLKAAGFVAGQPAQLAEKGLEPATLALSIYSGPEFEETTYILGGESPTKGRRYCMKKGSGFLLTVTEEDAAKLKVKGVDMREPRLATVEVDDINDISITRPGGALAMKRANFKWTITEPEEFPADPLTIKDALQHVKDTEIQEFLKADAPFKAAVTVRLTHKAEGRAEEFELSGLKGGSDVVTARRKGSAALFSVPKSLYEELTKPVLSFRSRLLLELNRKTILRIARKGPGDESITVVRGSMDEPWAVEGSPEVKLDKTAVENVLWRMAGLGSPGVEALVGDIEAADLAKYGLTEPTFTVSVCTAADGQSGDTHQLRVGRAPEGGKLYGMIAGATLVFKLSPGLADMLKASLFEVEEPKTDSKEAAGNAMNMVPGKGADKHGDVDAAGHQPH